MKIALHIGANCTDDDKLLKSLLKNADTFVKEGIKVPGPSKYRRIMRETIQNLDGAKPEEATRHYIQDVIIDGEEPQRLIMSNSNFICIPNRIFDGGTFYPQTEDKLRGVAALFPDAEFEIFIGLKNPATFLPAAFSKSKAATLDAFLKGFHPTHIRWSDIIRRVNHVMPNAGVTVWCNEDTPLIWAELIRAMADLPETHQITGGFDLLAKIMAPDGMKRMLDYMRSHPPKSEAHKRKIIAAFLDKYALDEEIEETVDLQGLDEQMIEDLTEIYDQDVEVISQMSGVRFIEP